MRDVHLHAPVTDQQAGRQPAVHQQRTRACTHPALGNHMKMLASLSLHTLTTRLKRCGPLSVTRDLAVTSMVYSPSLSSSITTCAMCEGDRGAVWDTLPCPVSYAIVNNYLHNLDQSSYHIYQKTHPACTAEDTPMPFAARALLAMPRCCCYFSMNDRLEKNHVQACLIVKHSCVNVSPETPFALDPRSS